MTVRIRSSAFALQNHDHSTIQVGPRSSLRRVGILHVSVFVFAEGSVFQGGYTKVSGTRCILAIGETFMIVVEYAMEAISHAGTVLGVLAKDGVVLAAEKKVTGKLLDLSGTKEGGYGGSGEKIFLLNSYVQLSSRSFAHLTSMGAKKCHRRRSRHYSRRKLPCELRPNGRSETSILLQ